MPYSTLTYIGWPLLVIIMLVMVYRKLQRQFPFFFSYLLAVVSTDIARFILFEKRMVLPYFYVYWITEAVEVLLAFFVLYEVFLVRLFPGFNITVIYRRLFPVMAIIVVALTAWTFLRAPSTGPSKIAGIIGAATLALNFCQVAFLAFFSILMLYMSREWRRHELGIAVGFGVYGAVRLLVTSERAKHFYAPLKFDQAPTIAYLVAVAIWLFYLAKSDPVPEETPITDEMVEEAEKSYQEISHLLKGRSRRERE